MSSQPERERGDLWAERLREAGYWVQKLPASSLSGMPDWLVGHPRGMQGTRWVEAKTLEAVLAAKGHRPWEACSGAQRFWLQRAGRAGDRCSVLVLSADRYLELDWKDARAPLTLGAFVKASQPLRVH